MHFQLIECLNDWVRNFDENVQTDVVYLDFAKAFDSVPHDRLLLKLRHLGIRGKILRWIQAYLKGRKQRVVLRNGQSSWCEVDSGVPQGSILGPLLFLLFINDLPISIDSSIKLFADDTKLYRKIESLEDCESLQRDLNRLGAWSKQWSLRFNEKKCVVLKIREKLDYCYTLNGVKLDSVESQRDLGIMIYNKLSPSEHVQSLVSKSNRKIHMIKRCFLRSHSSKNLCVVYIYRSSGLRICINNMEPLAQKRYFGVRKSSKTMFKLMQKGDGSVGVTGKA